MIQKIKDEIKPKNKFWGTMLNIGLFALKLVIKNQKGIKGTSNADAIDRIL